MAAGLPAWKDLLKLVARGCELPADFDRLGPLDQAEYLAGLLGPEQLNARVVDCIERPIPKVALAHAFLVSLGAKEAVTTNYDDRYERAAEAAGRRRPAVLPWEAPDEVAQWLLKLHGDSKRPDSVVLTRRDFVLFDARSRPAGSLLQAILLTKHLLVVGASLADDNVIRLAMEVDDYLGKNMSERDEHRSESDGGSGLRGTFIDVSGVHARRDLWKDQFHWFVCEGDSREQRVRRMEVFLDAVAAYATSDTSWLLDPRFEGLLNPGEVEVVRAVRNALDNHELHRGLLKPLGDVLRAFGAT